MPKVSPEHSDARRRQILEAAFRCFSRKGFHATTMREICAEADLSAGAVYSYFDGKDAIITNLAEVGRRNTREWLEGRTSDEPSAPALPGLLREVFALTATDGSFDSVKLDLRITAEALDNPELRELAVRGLTNVASSFAELARRAQDEGRIDPGLDARAIGQVMVALYNGLSAHRVLDPEVDLEAALRVVEALFAGGFAVPAPPGDARE